MRTTDVLVIGSEGAGARAALEARRRGAEVLIVTKGKFGRSGATLTAEADYNIDSRTARLDFGLEGDLRDSTEQYYADTLAGGKDINDRAQLSVMVDMATHRLQELVKWGLHIEGLLHTNGHTYPRGVYVTGQNFVSTLGRQLRRSGTNVLEETMVTDLLVGPDGVCGAIGLDLRQGEPVEIRAKAVVIATGGAPKLYPYRTGPEELTGDGQAMAWRAGARLVDMEMVQFGPNRFIDPPILHGNQFPNQFCRYLDVWLLNRSGERFMKNWDPQRMERSTRDFISIGMMSEVLAGRGSPAGGVYMTANHLPRDLIETLDEWAMQPHLKKGWIYQGYDFSMVRDRLLQGYGLEVGPACHFFMGGVQVDGRGWTGIPGLYAAGEATGGVDGANRLSGNAFTQIIVQGAAAGDTAAQYAGRLDHCPPPDPTWVDDCKAAILAPLGRTHPENAYDIVARIQAAAWLGIGVVRSHEGLEKFLAALDSAATAAAAAGCRSRERVYSLEWVEALGLRNLITCGRAIALSALCRTESRGAHYRQDYPHRDDAQWLGNVVTQPPAGDGSLSVTFAPLSRSHATGREGDS